MKSIKIVTGALIMALTIACGGNTSKEEQTDEDQPTSREIMQREAGEQEKTQEPKADEYTGTVVDGVREVSIEATDQMRFGKNEIKVKAGETVRLTLKHVGKLPKEQMGHNWVLLAKGTDIMEFGQKASTAEENEYIPAEEEGKVIVHTELLGGGQEDTIEFEVPEKGSYDFICSFPGHYTIMQGKFIVE